MASATTTHDGDLDQVFELNRLFLRLLRSRAAERRPCLGLEASVVRRVRGASDARLDALAELPRALFKLNLDAARVPRRVADPSGPRLDSATQSLQLTALLTAWNFSRRSTYAARLFLDLTAAEVVTLGRLPLSSLPPLATQEGLVTCAFARTSWLWRRLLSESRPEQRRRLLLVALQPQTDFAPQAGRRALGS